MHVCVCLVFKEEPAVSLKTLMAILYKLKGCALNSLVGSEN